MGAAQPMMPMQSPALMQPPAMFTGAAQPTMPMPSPMQVQAATFQEPLVFMPQMMPGAPPQVQAAPVAVMHAAQYDVGPPVQPPALSQPLMFMQPAAQPAQLVYQ